MNQSIPLSIVLVSIAVAFLAWGLYQVVKMIVLSARRTAEATESLRSAVILLNERIEANSANVIKWLHETSKVLEPAPRLLEAVMKIGDAQLQIMQAQREAQQNPFKRPNGPLPPRDVDTANMEYEISEAMRTYGVSREEAMLRMNGANDRSVWSGNKLVENWRG